MWAFYGRIGNQASYKRTFMQVFIHMDRVNFANIWVVVVVGGGDYLENRGEYCDISDSQ